MREEVARQSVGDYLGARQLFEQVLELRSRELPEDHPLLLDARMNSLLVDEEGRLRLPDGYAVIERN